jgi:hypothetical protein
MDVRRVIAVLPLAALLGACDSPRTPLQPRDLKIAAQQLQSIATEGKWLARELRAGSITPNMAWLHQQSLADDAAKAVDEIAKPAPDRLRAEQQHLLVLSARLRAEVGRIAQAAQDPDGLAALGRELDGVAREAAPVARPA